MYTKPVLQRFGGLRALTLAGIGGEGDGGLGGISFLAGPIPCGDLCGSRS